MYTARWSYGHGYCFYRSRSAIGVLEFVSSIALPRATFLTVQDPEGCELLIYYADREEPL